MPQPAQRSLVQVLLLWITILSIIQIMFITYFFTSGHHDKHQNCSNVPPGYDMIRSPVTNKPLLQLGKGKMLTFKADTDDGKLKWIPKNTAEGLFSVEEDTLTIDNDGYYFINLQVKLDTCDGYSAENLKVSLKWTNESQKSTDILQGEINTSTCSTGLLAKVAILSVGTLKVTINLPADSINTTESLTHLDVIYMSLN